MSRRCYLSFWVSAQAGLPHLHQIRSFRFHNILLTARTTVLLLSTPPVSACWCIPRATRAPLAMLVVLQQLPGLLGLSNDHAWLLAMFRGLWWLEAGSAALDQAPSAVGLTSDALADALTQWLLSHSTSTSTRFFSGVRAIGVVCKFSVAACTAPGQQHPWGLPGTGEIGWVGECKWLDTAVN
jgi:hypothetical protein